MAGSNEEAIKTKLVVEGEKEYKKACSGINTSLREIGSEMRVVSAEFAGNEKSTEALRKKQDLLKKTLAEQSQKVKEAEKALKQFADGGVDESSDAVVGMKTALNSAKAEMIKTENQIKATNKELKQSHIDWSAAGAAASKGAKAFAAGVAAISVAAGTLAIKLGTDVVKSFGNLEQNLGGSEAVFGQYASTIQKTGEDAYKNLGVSQSEYLASANKMGALFQGSGLTQQKSLELTEKAMQRAADMASVMGIDTKDAMEAVTGAAKGNYTMMDNLGVSMNETSLKAFLLSSGMAKNKKAADKMWKSMSQADKTELAMQMFFENTEQYAGNFARESTQTISGSFGLLKSAASSLVAGLGNNQADISNLAENMVDAFLAVATNVMPVIQNIATVLPQALETALAGLGTVAPQLIGSFSELFGGIFSTISSSLPTIANLAVELVQGLVTGITASLPMITESAVTIVTSLCNGLITMLPTILNGAVQLVTGLAQGIAAAIPTLLPTIVQVITSIVTTLIENIPLLIDAALQLVTGLAQGVLNAIPVLIAAVPTIITSLITSILESIPLIIQAGIDLISSLVTSLPTIIETIVAAIPQIITGILTALTTNVPLIVQAGIDLITSLITSLPTIIETIVAAIPQIITGITTALIEAAPLLVQAGIDLFGQLIANLPVIIENIIAAAPQIIDGLVTAFGNLGESVLAIGTNIVSGIWDGISGAAAWIAEKVSGFFDGILGGICDFLGIHSPSTVFADKVGANMAAGVGDGFTGEMSDVSTSMTGAMDSAGTVTAEQAIAAVNAGIMSNLSLLSEAIKAVVDAILTGLNTDSARLTAVGTTMLDAMVQGMVTAGATVAAKVNQIVTAIASAFEAKKPIFTAEGVTMCSSIAQGLLDGMVAITANVPVMVDTMLINFVSQHPKLSSEGGEMDKQIGQGMIDNISNITGKAAQIVQSIITAFSGFNSEFVFIGENMVAGIWQGFQNKQDWIEDQLRSMMRRLVKIVEDEMDINSPSKVFARIGEYMALGLGGGWKAQMSAVEKDIKKTTSNIIPTTTGARQADTSRAGGGFNFTQNVYANETSYAEQQRQAAKQFRLIARGLC